MVLASVAEVVSIGLVVPFLGALMSPERLFLHPFLRQWVAVLGIDQPRQLLFFLTATFILVALISGGMRLILLWMQTRLGFAVGADLSVQIYKKTLYQPYLVHVARNSNEVISGIVNKTNGVIYGTLLPVLSIASSSILLVAILAVLIAIDPFAAFSAFGVFGALYGVIMVASRKRLSREGALISRESNQVLKALQEGLGGIRDVLIDGTQATYCKIYSDADLPLRRAQASIHIIGSSPRFLIESFGMVLIAVLAYLLAGREEGISGAIPVLGALAIGAQRLLPVLQQLYLGWSHIQSGKDSLQDVLNLLEQPLPEYADEPHPPPIFFRQEVKLSQMSFRYSESLPWVLSNINIAIPRGARIGFMGSTGSGKSTLLDLIMGLLQPTDGLIEIDGVSINEKNHRSWQMHIAHVPQSIFLADTSVAENIAFGMPLNEIDHSRVMLAARQAQIDTAIESWPEGYNTFVGERGIRLSGGQRQRIGIARALYKRADVIVFDEATSALDNNTEQAVMDAINNISKDITVLMVAHRLSTLQGCDLVYELESGRVTRMGSYLEMVSRSEKS